MATRRAGLSVSGSTALTTAPDGTPVSTAPSGEPRILVTAAEAARGKTALGALRACRAIADEAGADTAVLIEIGNRRPRPATVIATAAAKQLEERLSGQPVGGQLSRSPDEEQQAGRTGEQQAAPGETPASCSSRPNDVADEPDHPARPARTVRARGGIVFVSINEHECVADEVSGLIDSLPAGIPCVVVVPSVRFREVLESRASGWDRVLVRADLDPEEGLPPLLELVLDEAREYSREVETVRSACRWWAGRRALAGRQVPARHRMRLFRTRLAADGGQATPLVLGGVFVLVIGTVALMLLAGAMTGKARGQRGADLAALSAAGSMKKDLPRLLAPPTLPNGLPNPAHMPKPVYLLRARVTAVRTAAANGASPLAVSVRFPDRFSWAPVRARVAVGVTVTAGKSGRSHRSPPVWAEARIGASVTMGAVPAVGSGGGYSGPLASRQGKGMRPDVAAAFDAMAAAAGAAGVTLAINSAFRSDTEQAALFAANPNPTMVARPGTSLHRCGTELDLGPSAAYGWLAANASRFGFLQRYSWEPWHYGFTAGPAPCSAGGDRVGRAPAGKGPGERGRAGGSGRQGDRSQTLPDSVPSFVPTKYRQPILRAAMKWNVSAALLAAQLYAESGFNPGVVSSAGAQGIAQFMPGTAAGYGLRNPFDPVAAIDAQGHLMSDLLKQFGSPALALAAYNAGPGAVSPCNCIPPYAETRAYVAKILAMLGGVGAIAPMPMEIELVR